MDREEIERLKSRNLAFSCLALLISIITFAATAYFSTYLLPSTLFGFVGAVIAGLVISGPLAFLLFTPIAKADGRILNSIFPEFDGKVVPLFNVRETTLDASMGIKIESDNGIACGDLGDSVFLYHLPDKYGVEKPLTDNLFQSDAGEYWTIPKNAFRQIKVLRTPQYALDVLSADEPTQAEIRLANAISGALGSGSGPSRKHIYFAATLEVFWESEDGDESILCAFRTDTDITGEDVGITGSRSFDSLLEAGMEHIGEEGADQLVSELGDVLGSDLDGVGGAALAGVEFLSAAVELSNNNRGEFSNRKGVALALATAERLRELVGLETVEFSDLPLE